MLKVLALIALAVAGLAVESASASDDTPSLAAAPSVVRATPDPSVEGVVAAPTEASVQDVAPRPAPVQYAAPVTGSTPRPASATRVASPCPSGMTYVNEATPRPVIAWSGPSSQAPERQMGLIPTGITVSGCTHSDGWTMVTLWGWVGPGGL